MNIGKPWEFSIMYELLEESEDKQWQYGFFNFLIDDQFIPGMGSNYTLGMTLNHLKGILDEIERAPVVDFSKYTDSFLFCNLSKALGWLPEEELEKALIASEEEFEEILKKNKELQLGVNITPLEVSDTGWRIYYFRFLDEECLLYSSDFGKTVKKKMLSLGTVAGVIKQLP